MGRGLVLSWQGFNCGMCPSHFRNGTNARILRAICFICHPFQFRHATRDELFAY